MHVLKLILQSSRRFSSTNCASYVQNSNLHNNLNFIAGKRCDGRSDSQLNNINPATGQVLSTFKESSADDVAEAVLAAKKAQLIWKDISPLERAKILNNAATLVRSDCDSLSHLEVLDTGKPLWEAEADILACADSILMYSSFATTIQGSHVALPGNSFYYTRREPIGVCGGIGAWNYPFQMAVWKSAPALACGNALVFKPSQLTPLTAVRLGELYHQAGIPAGLFSVVQGAGLTGEALCNNPDIAKISFTGSVSTGSRVMSSSSKFIRPVTLELGGKSPLIIFPDADINEAVKGAILANFLSQGQVCSNGTRVFVHKDIYNRFSEALVAAVSKMKIGDPFDPSVTVGAVINKNQFDISMKYIEGAKKEGATVAYGGDRVTFPESSPLNGGYFLRPCILTNCHDDMTVVKEEVFGSVLSLLEFSDEEDVIARANNTDLGLAGGVFTENLSLGHRVAGKLQAGSIYINNYNALPPGVPFGGYKMSGFGRENGLETLQYYTQVKSVYVEGGSIDYPFV